MKTPDQIADEFVDTITWPFDERTTISATELADMLAAAVEADRAQRLPRAEAEILADVVESGIAREVGALDVRHAYSEAEIDRLKSRWSAARATLATIKEMSA